ncbi:MAG: glycyl-radical enzyme activating protein [Armatimonadetes bacterium]|nr:glycyl-radical enzyme activating protein [Armatimonadota bacterium]
MRGIVFDIKRFAVHDGPGIRTTVFLKGCPLRCDWCHNPESQSSKPVVAQFRRNCIGCGKCIEACPQHGITAGEDGIVINRALCQSCGACTRVCVAEALVLRGQEMTVEQVMAEVEKDRAFYENSGGGMTLSGGEPLYQPEFALALLQAAKAAGLHTCLDTSGHAFWPVLEQMLPYVDMVLYDVKGMDPRRHQQYTGRSNRQILENLRHLTEDGVRVHVRVPVIKGYNDETGEMTELARYLRSLKNTPSVELLPYHRLGEGKYESLGIRNGHHREPPSREQVEALAALIRDLGLECQVGG